MDDKYIIINCMKRFVVMIFLIIFSFSEVKASGFDVEAFINKDREKRLGEIVLLSEKILEQQNDLDSSIEELTNELSKSENKAQQKISIVVAAAGVTIVHYYFKKLGVGRLTFSGLIMNLQSSASLILADILAGAVYMGERPTYITDQEKAVKILQEMLELRKALSVFRRKLKAEKKYLCKQNINSIYCQKY